MVTSNVFILKFLVSLKFNRTIQTTVGKAFFSCSYYIIMQIIRLGSYHSHCQHLFVARELPWSRYESKIALAWLDGMQISLGLLYDVSRSLRTKADILISGAIFFTKKRHLESFLTLLVIKTDYKHNALPHLSKITS